MGPSVETKAWMLLAGIVLVAHSVSLGLKRLQMGFGGNGGDPNSLAQWDLVPWMFIGNFSGVETFVKAVPGSALHAFRGETLLEGIHISSAMSHFYDVSLAHEWIDFLHDIREFSYPPPLHPAPTDLSDEKDRLVYDQPFYKSRRAQMRLAPLTESLTDVDMVYEVMRLPWPVAPRDILLRRDWNYDYEKKCVTVRYRSVEDSIRVPTKPGTIRAFSPHTLWRFRNSPRGTYIEIECLVDSKGSLPALLINFFQRSFPSKALRAFGRLVKKGKVAPHKRVIDW